MFKNVFLWLCAINAIML